MRLGSAAYGGLIIMTTALVPLSRPALAQDQQGGAPATQPSNPDGSSGAQKGHGHHHGQHRHQQQSQGNGSGGSDQH